MAWPNTKPLRPIDHLTHTSTKTNILKFNNSNWIWLLNFCNLFIFCKMYVSRHFFRKSGIWLTFECTLAFSWLKALENREMRGASRQTRSFLCLGSCCQPVGVIKGHCLETTAFSLSLAASWKVSVKSHMKHPSSSLLMASLSLTPLSTWKL